MLVGIASHGNDEAATGSAAVEEDSVDLGFSRDMQDHHAQAVEMSVLVREATEDPQVRTLALDIMLTQQHQAGQMFGWLAAGAYPQSGQGEPMTWMTADARADDMAGMDHGAAGEGSTASSTGASEPDTRMPGMATDAQLRQLEQAEGRRAERIYLQLMIPHHQAGVAMAEYAVEHASQPQVQRLAQSIVNSQTSELQVLRSMLDAHGGPLPDL